MATAATNPGRPTHGDIPVPRVVPPGSIPGPRVLVLYEPCGAGRAALDVARELDLREQAALTVVAVVPKAESGPCTGSALEFNRAVREAVECELDDARERLAEASGRADYRLLIEGEDPSLESWTAVRDFDLILLPARRRLLRAARHPAAARLRRSTSAEVRVVSGKAASGVAASGRRG
jgi:hypothetical protein